MRYALLILLLSLALLSNGQGSERKFPRGIFLRNSFSSNTQINNYNNPNPAEMDIGIGIFALIPITLPLKDSLSLLQMKYRPKPWSLKHLRLELGLIPNRGATFYTSPTQSFHLVVRGLDMGISIPLYFKPSDDVNAYFASGISGSYYLSNRVVANGGSPPPDVYIQNFSAGITLEFGFLVGKPGNPVLLFSNRFLEQLIGNYKFREFSISVGIPISKKFGR